MRDGGDRRDLDRITGSRESCFVHPAVPCRNLGRRQVILSKILFLLFLAGCSTQKQSIPEWVVRPQEKYPQSRYLVAVGEGDSRRAAENSAAAGLSRIFEAKVESKETLSETTTEARGAEDRFDQLSELRADIRIGSEQNLLNIQFGESFTDDRGRVYTAAYLPRAETAEILRQRIAANSADLLLLIRQSEQVSDPLNAYAFRRVAVKKALENDRLLAQLDIIAPGSRDRTALPYDPQTLYSETAAAAQKVTFSVSLSGEAGDALREALSGMGFSEGSPAVLLFSGRASIDKTDLRRDPLVFVRTLYQIEARDRTGNLVLSISDTSREGHINAELATERARQVLRRNILQQIPEKLGGTLDRLASSQL